MECFFKSIILEFCAFITSIFLILEIFSSFLEKLFPLLLLILILSELLLAKFLRVLELLLSKGVRLALPGEFTKRAFLNGRIDLLQAEAVMDIINADTENARNLSINQLSGKLSSRIRTLKEKLIEVEANIEVNIDYPEYEDIEEMTESKVYKPILK